MSRPAPAHGPARAPRTPFLLLLGALVVGGLCALLALNTASAANELSRHDVAAKDASIAAQVQQLRNDVAASGAPGNLATAAAALGMVPAGNPAFLRIGPDGRVVVLGSAAAASNAPTPTPTPPPTRPKPTPTKKTTSRSTSKTATKSPTPTPTPTPTTTLPGGTR